MKNYEVFEKIIQPSNDSPTGFIYKRSGKIAGNKASIKGYEYWVINTRYKNKPYCWSIPRLLFELATGIELPTSVTIGFHDNNHNNLSLSNLYISPRRKSLVI